MTYLVERLAELRRHLDHLKQIRGRVLSELSLRQDLSLHNDVMFSLLTVCQLVIDLAGELSAQKAERFENYTQAVRNLAKDPRFAPDLVDELARLPGFRNVVIHDYIELDYNRVIEALYHLEPIERFCEIVCTIVSESR